MRNMPLPAFKKIAVQLIVMLCLFSAVTKAQITINGSGSYATITAAIAAASPGNVIQVPAGVYNENLDINKSLILRGAQWGNCALFRTGAETVISCPNGIGVNAGNVTIDGFTIQDQDGANAALAPGFGFAVYMVPPNTGTQLLNNIIRNNTLGTGLSNAGSFPAQVNINCNWYDANNTPGPGFREAIYADSDISGGSVSNVFINDNKFTNHIEGVGIDFEMVTAGTRAESITMTNNLFDGNLRAVTFYNVVSSLFSNNEIKNSTFGSVSADLRIFGGANNLTVRNNSFDGSNALAPHAIRMTSGVGPNANVSILENSFTGYSTTNTVFLNPQSYTGGAIPATCNWFGTANAATIASLIGSPVSYIPYLSDGTDASPNRGFQPVPGSCNGTNQPPSITCPQNITLDCSVEIPNPDVESVIVSGFCPGISVTWEGDEVTNQTCVSSFTILRTYKATDVCGNTATCIQTITVADTTAPTLTVPANITLQCTDPLPLQPLNINSSPNFIDGTYNVGTAVFGAPLTATPVTADAVLVNDGTGGAGNPYDACESILNDLTGKIAVIERSGCTPPASYFVTKAYKAQQAGAVGVIFIFNQPGNNVATMGLPAGPNPTITIPLMLVSNTYGATLKSELLAGPVNVSLSAPTVIASDICSFATITHQQTFTPGNCPSSYTLVNTWTATDQCGNATTASQTITVADTTAPTLTVPANITLQCTDPLPLQPLNINSSPNFIDGTYNVGTAVFGAPLTATPVTADAVLVNDGTGGAGNPYDACESILNDLTGKIAVIERSGCTPPASYFVTKAYKAQQAGAVGVIFIFNQPGNNVATMGLPAGPNPTITIPLMLVSNTYGATLKSELLAGPVNVSLSAPTVIASDICSFATITHQQTFTAGSCPSSYTLVNTWTATDQCGNATTASQTITVADTTAPTLTVPANITLQCTDPLPLQPLNINSSPNFIDGTYNVGTAVFGAPLTATPVTADAVLVNDGTGGAGNPYDACESILNDLTGKIAVIERSGCTPPASYFVTKAYKAQQAGAVGVIFIFNQPGNNVATMGLPAGPNPTITIPLMLVSNTYGATLKSELLAGPVNVSLSAPTVIASDICSFATITHQQTFTAGSCPSSYTLVNTWTATDQCGNATTASQTITVADTTAPVVTAGTIASCYVSVAAAQAAAIAATTATDNCSGTLTKIASTTGTCSAVVTVTVTDGCGNSAIKIYNTRIDNTPPTVTGGTIASCYTTVAAAQAAAIAATIATDNCPGTLTKTASTTGTCIAVVRVTVTDGCGNSATRTYNTRIDNTPPVVTCKANQTRLTNNGYCTYTAVGTEFNVSSATDNCPGAVGLSYTLSGATSGSGINTLNGATFNTGITTVTWKATDGCGNFATCSFNITVNDDQNSTNYIIYAKSFAKFGEQNDINGDVGVTDANGSAEFKKNTDLNPFLVKAKNITVQLPANVSNRIYAPATGGPTPPFMIYNGTGGSGTLNVSVNGTYNGNYKNLTVKKGVTATITGNDFGKIKIEEGADVTFTATIINMQQLLVERGKKNVNTTNVYFVNPATVKISEKVTVEEDCMVNVNGPKVTFYLGDSNKDEEKFIVTGDNTMITLNIMIPNGKLKVTGGPREGIMTGWFITEKIQSEGKKTTWNKYDCFVAPQFAKGPSENVEPEIKEKPIETEIPVVADVFAVKIYPNPTPGDFNIQVTSKSDEPIMVRIMNVNGTLVQASTKLTKQGLIALTNKLPGGTYFVEVTQGKNHSVTKLVKLN